MSKGISPEIHFKGYTDTWKQRKLGDEVIEMVAGGDIDKSLLDEHGKYPVIANALTDDGIVGYYASDYRIKAPAVTVTGRGDVGHAKARTIDFTPVVRLLSVRSKHDVFFLENAINTLNVIVESTGVPQLTVPQLSQYEIFFPPTITEEKEIGAFFDRVDSLIALHQRKYTKLKNYKSAIANKIFPAIGQQPVLRIIDKEPWKEVPLSEIGDYFSTDSLGYADLIEDGKYKCLLYGDLYTKYNEKVMNVKSSTDKLVTKLFKGDILFPTSTTVDALSLIAPSSVCEDDVYAGGDLFGIRPKVGINGTFVSYYINNKHSLKNSLSKNAQGLTIVHIHYDNIKDEKIMLPEYDEQIAIVSLFTALDNLIESENNYINKLKIIKQAFLSKMLVEVEA